MNKIKELNSKPLSNITKQQLYSNDDSHTPNFAEEDNELVRLNHFINKKTIFFI
jgi:hypothetical protein